MRKFVATAGLLLGTLALAPSAQAAFISGDVTGGGSFNGQVSSNTAWVQDNAYDGMEVNFWTFTANAGQSISVSVSSLVNEGGQMLDAGISLFYGEVTAPELLYAGFNHADDFADNQLVTTTNLYYGSPGNDASILEILLTQSGIYTIAVGGEAGFSLHDSYHYDMDVSIVPIPAAIWLLGTGLLGLAGLSRRKQS